MHYNQDKKSMQFKAPSLHLEHGHSKAVHESPAVSENPDPLARPHGDLQTRRRLGDPGKEGLKFTLQVGPHHQASKLVTIGVDPDLCKLLARLEVPGHDPWSLRGRATVGIVASNRGASVVMLLYGDPANVLAVVVQHKRNLLHTVVDVSHEPVVVPPSDWGPHSLVASEGLQADVLRLTVHSRSRHFDVS